MSNWLDSSGTSNMLITTYVKGFVDVSGGDLINRNGNLTIARDASLNRRLFLGGDMSMNAGGRLLVSGDVSLNGNLFIGGKANLVGDVSINSRLFAAGDASFGSKLFVLSDLSISGRLYGRYPASSIPGTAVIGGVGSNTLSGDFIVGNRLFITGDVSMSPLSRLFVLGDISTNSGTRLYVGSDVSFSGNSYTLGPVIIGGDVSINKGVIVGSDVSLGGRLLIVGDLSINGNLYANYLSNSILPTTFIGGVTSNVFSVDGQMPNRLFLGRDLSMSSGNIYTTNFNSTSVNTTFITDISINNRLFVGGDASLGGQMLLYGDISINGNLYANYYATSISRSAVIGGINNNLFTTDVSLVGRLYLSSDVTMSSRLFINADVSTNSGVRLFVGSDVSFGGNIYIPGNAIITGDISANGRLFMSTGNDASFGGNLYVRSNVNIVGDVSNGGRLFVGRDVSFGGNLYGVGSLSVGGDISTNRVFVGGDVSMNRNLFVSKVVNIGGNIYTASDVSFGSRLFLGTDLSVGGRMFIGVNVNANSRLFVGGDLSFGGNLTSNSISTSIISTYFPSFGGTLLVASGWVGQSPGNIAVSQTGQYMVGQAYSSGVQISSSYGVFWTYIAKPTSRAYFDVTGNMSISSSGQYMLYAVFLSTNYGYNWGQVPSPVNWDYNGSAISQSGKFMAIAERRAYSGAVIWVSSNYGSTWLTRTLPFVSDSLIAMSDNGTYILLPCYSGNTAYLYFSTNFGVNFAQATGVPASLNWYSMVVSSTGQYMAASNSINTTLYLSSSYGSFWTTAAVSTPYTQASMRMSYSGKYLVASSGYGSSNYGMNWSLVYNFFYAATFYAMNITQTTAIAMSGNNEYVVSGYNISGVAEGVSILTPTTIITNNYFNFLTNSLAIGSNSVPAYRIDVSGSSVPSFHVGVGANTHALTVPSNGFLGIGTTNPLYTLDVSGTSNFSTDLSFGSNTRLFAKSLTGSGKLFVPLDVSLGPSSRLFVGRDVSMGQRLFVGRDMSINSNLFISKDVTVGGNLTIYSKLTNLTVQNTTLGLLLAQDMSLNGRLFIAGDMSLNGRFFVVGDVSFAGNVYVARSFIGNGDISMNARLFVSKDAKINGNVSISNSPNLIGDVSINSRVYVIGDVSMNGNLTIGSKLIITVDISSNRRLFVGGGAGLGGNIFVPNQMFVSGDVSTNNRLFIPRDVSINGTLNTRGPFLIGGDLSSAIMSSRLFLGGDASFGRDVTIPKYVTFLNDVSINGRIFIKSDLSLGVSSVVQVYGMNTLTNDFILTRRLLILNDISMTNGNIYATNFASLLGKVIVPTVTPVFTASPLVYDYYKAPATAYNSASSFTQGIVGTSWFGNYWNAGTGSATTIASGVLAMNSTGQYAIDVSNGLWLSTNYGVNWLANSSFTSNNLVSAAMSTNGQWAIVGDSANGIYYSTNAGINWANSSSSYLGYATESIGINVSNSIIINQSGSWVAKSTPSIFSSGAGGVAEGKGVIVVGGTYLYYSTNAGQTWNPAQGNFGTVNLIFSIVFGNNIFSLAGVKTTTNPWQNVYAYSTNGINWTAGGNGLTTTNSSGLQNELLFLNNMFVTWVGTETMAYSSDGINFTYGGISGVMSMAYGLFAGTYKYVCMVYSDTDNMYSSTNLISWAPAIANFSPYQQHSGSGGRSGIAYGNNCWVIFGWTTSGGYRMKYSADNGVTWLLSNTFGTIPTTIDIPGMLHFSPVTNLFYLTATHDSVNKTAQSSTNGQYFANAGITSFKISLGSYLTPIITTLTSGTWSSVSISSSSPKAIASTSGSIFTGLYYSTNAGQFWISSNINTGTWSTVFIQSAGANAVAGGSGTGLYYSANSGQTWTISSVTSGIWTTVEISGTGSAAIAAGTGTGIYYSTNSGINWLISNITSGNFNSSAITSSGQYAIVTPKTPGSIYYSTNSGQNWITSLYNSVSTNVAISGDGQLVLATPGVSSTPICSEVNQVNPIIVTPGSDYLYRPIPGQTVFYTDVSFASNARLFAYSIQNTGINSLNGGAVSNTFTTTNTTDTNINNDLLLSGRLFINDDINIGALAYQAYPGYAVYGTPASGRLFIGGDVSMGGNLNIPSRFTFSGDVSANGRLYVTRDVSGGGLLGVSGSSQFLQDVYMSSRLYVGNDVSFNRRVFVSNSVTMMGDISLNGRLFTGKDGSIRGNLFTNGTMIISGDLSGGSRLFLQNDVSLGGNITVGGLGIIRGDLSVNRRLFVGGDVSMGGNLFVAATSIYNSDVNFMNRLFVGSDVSINNRTFFNNAVNFMGDVTSARMFAQTDVSFLGNWFVSKQSIIGSDISLITSNRLFVGGDVSFGGNVTVPNQLLVMNDLSTNSRTIIQTDVSLNGRLIVNSRTNFIADISMNSRLFGGGDLSLGGNLYISQKTVTGSDISGNRLFIAGQTTIGQSKLIIGPINSTTLSTILQSTPTTAMGVGAGTGQTSGINNTFLGAITSVSGGSLSQSTAIGYGAIITGSNQIVLGTSNETFVAMGDVSANGRLYVLSDVSLNGSIIINQVNPLTVLGDVSANARIFIGGDVSANGKLTVSGDFLIGGQLNVNQYTNQAIITTRVTNTNILSIGEDISANNRLFITGDVSGSAQLYVGSSSIYGGDLSLGGRLFVGGDVSMGTAGGGVVISTINYTVTNNGAGSYSIDNLTNPTLNLVRGSTYTFTVTAGGHPFWIQTSTPYNSSNVYNNGVTNNGIDTGTITFVVPSNAPNQLYYVCQYHSSMAGIIQISDRVVYGILYTNSLFGAGNTVMFQQGPTGPTGATGRMGVYTDVSLNTITGRLFVVGDVSLGGNLFIQNASRVIKDISANARLFVGSDVSLGGNIVISGNTVIVGDISSNNRLFVSGNVSLGGNLNVPGRAIFIRDISINGRLFVSSDVSLNGNTNVLGFVNTQQQIKSVSTVTIVSLATTLDMNTGYDFYTAASTSNFRVNFVNVPVYTNTGFTVNLYIDTSSNRVYGNTYTISPNQTVNGTVVRPSTTYTLSTASKALQTFTFMNGNVYTNVLPYY